MGKVWGKILKGCLTALLVVGMMAVNTVNVKCTEGTYYTDINEATEAIIKEMEAAGFTMQGSYGEEKQPAKNDIAKSEPSKEKSTPVKTCEHHYVDEIIKASTCAEEGEMVSKCSKCGDSYKTVLAATGNHDYSSEETVAPTCTNPGEMTYTCTVCGDSYTEELPVIDHEYEESITKQATCVETGEKTFICKMCGDFYTEEIPAKGHAEADPVITKEAGWFTEGETVTKCSECGEVLSTKVIPNKYPISYLYVGVAIIGILVITGIVFLVFKKKKGSKKEELAKGA